MVSKIDLGILALGALAVFLIVRGGGKFLEGLQFPSIGDITFPEINFPEFPNPFGNAGQTVQESLDSAQQTTQDVVSDQFSTVTQDQQTPFDPLGAGLGGLFAGIADFFGLTPAEEQTVDPIQTPEIIDAEGQPVITPPSLDVFAESITPQVEQVPFVGGGDFVGGGIFETPIANLSLSEIIERFDVTASQAANIQATAQDNFGNFDFGTNTGSGIGGVLADIDNQSQLGIGNVSNPEFAGLTATEIAQQLTGGNINNF